MRLPKASVFAFRRLLSLLSITGQAEITWLTGHALSGGLFMGGADYRRNLTGKPSDATPGTGKSHGLGESIFQTPWEAVLLTIQHDYIGNRTTLVEDVGTRRFRSLCRHVGRT